MKNLAALFVVLQLLLAPASVAAQVHSGARIVSTETWVEEWDPATRRWVRVEDTAADTISQMGANTGSGAHGLTSVTTITTRIYGGRVVASSTNTQPVHARPPDPSAIARYGPFTVVDEARAQLVGSTGGRSPAFFAAMMRDFPELEVLELIEAPGTSNDIANLAIGRAIRAAGLRTHVPNRGSVRSGAVELFLAGKTQTMEPGAQFAVHSWIDERGREPEDFAPDAPENRLYLDYYVEMGMSQQRAREFYAMTNSVPHAGALWLRADDMAPWVVPSRPAARVKRFAKLDFLDNAKPMSLAAVVPLTAWSNVSAPHKPAFPLAMLSDTALKTFQHAPLVLRDAS
ncbi:alpha/beta hydrolase [Erythrobacter sp. MTPC3]|uniref:alpha/beta hydrolase n=1 Tax=Erythrobacter sp. MTPC3 TaxID=3056564 RepID=UPI0036F1CD79